MATLVIVTKHGDKFSKSFKIRVSYYAGNGEAYIKSLSVWSNGEWVKHADDSDDDVSHFDEVEFEFSHTINQHEHDNGGGTGYFIAEHGTIIEQEFERY